MSNLWYQLYSLQCSSIKWLANNNHRSKKNYKNYKILQIYPGSCPRTDGGSLLDDGRDPGRPTIGIGWGISNCWLASCFRRRSRSNSAHRFMTIWDESNSPSSPWRPPLSSPSTRRVSPLKINQYGNWDGRTMKNRQNSSMRKVATRNSTRWGKGDRWTSIPRMTIV